MTANRTVAETVPEVSVVLPVRNEAEYLAEQLHALSTQDFTGCWEVVVADNGSTDRSREVVEEWSDRLPSLDLIDASEGRGTNVARNVGARQARGDLLLFADGDDIVSTSWVSTMVAVLASADLATGPLELFDDRGRDLGREAAHGPAVALKFLPYGIGCNLGVRRRVFDRVGGFDESWPVVGADEIDFCWRAQLRGAELGFSEGIRVRYRRPSTPGATFVKQVGYGIGDVLLSRRYAALGASRLSVRHALWRSVVLLRELPDLLTGRRRIVWVGRAGWLVGLVRGLVRYRREPV